MTKNKYIRIAKLEDATNIKERSLVIPLCCYYGEEDRKCDCKPYYTCTPQVIAKGLDAFYKEVNESCRPMPQDAELAECEYNGKS